MRARDLAPLDEKACITMPTETKRNAMLFALGEEAKSGDWKAGSVLAASLAPHRELCFEPGKFRAAAGHVLDPRFTTWVVAPQVLFAGEPTEVLAWRVMPKGGAARAKTRTGLHLEMTATLEPTTPRAAREGAVPAAGAERRHLIERSLSRWRWPTPVTAPHATVPTIEAQVCPTARALAETAPRLERGLWARVAVLAPLQQLWSRMVGYGCSSGALRVDLGDREVALGGPASGEQAIATIEATLSGKARYDHGGRRAPEFLITPDLF